MKYLPNSKVTTTVGLTIQMYEYILKVCVEIEQETGVKRNLSWTVNYLLSQLPGAPKFEPNIGFRNRRGSHLATPKFDETLSKPIDEYFYDGVRLYGMNRITREDIETVLMEFETVPALSHRDIARILGESDKKDILDAEKTLCVIAYLKTKELIVDETHENGILYRLKEVK